MLKDIVVLARQNALRILNFAQGKSAFSEKIAFRGTREHILTFEALKAYNPERTEASVFLHIMNGRQRFIQALEKRD